MGSQSRRADSPLKQELYEKGYRFGFFQAVRLLQWFQPGRQGVGETARPSEEVVRFRARQSLSFPPSEIHAVQSLDSNEQPPQMTVAFMGLTGPSGVLPRHYTELLLDRIRQKDYTVRDFLDLFNHRMISLFYRSWAKHHCFVGFERAISQRGEDRFAEHLFAIVGLGTKGLREQLEMDPRTLLRYTGLLAQQRHSAQALQHCIMDFFRVPAEIHQFIGAWHQLDESDWTRLGVLGGNNVLGKTALAGTKIWDQQAKFQLRLGPLEYPAFSGLLPSGKAYPTLVQLTKCFAGLELDFDIHMVLKAAEVPFFRLGHTDQYAPRLGWTTWLKTEEFKRDADDVRFSGAAATEIVGTA